MHILTALRKGQTAEFRPAMFVSMAKVQDWLRSSAKSTSDKIIKERLKGCSHCSAARKSSDNVLSGRELLRLFLRLADQL